ncbi:Cytochrome c-type biogenesis protein DsbD,protein-disulfide reductase [Pseudoalteromonas luteoviolacea B = ATCC 29581]|nr:Cytochrome c-type biogenesis protein DsbD,protein-disulfide reductase [Pseudoalteromonas luteoviolacea B = ATCC 29581]
MRIFLLILSLLCLPVMASNSVLDSLLAPKQQTFLPVNEAFKLDFDQQDDVLFVGWDIAPGYYLYRHKLEFVGKGVDLTLPDFAPGVEIEDEFFGKTQVYFDQFSLVAKLTNLSENAVVKIRYQGCAEAGLCYPPEIVTIPLSTSHSSSQTVLSSMNLKDDATTAAVAQNQSDRETSSSTSFTDKLASQSLITNVGLFFLAGLGLAFTPCVFPMFPILSSLIAGQKGLSTRKAFGLSFVYVQGMAITYALLGLVIAHFGGQVQGYLQQPAVLYSFSLLFVLLALSMFGWFELRLPSSLTEKLTNVSNQQKGGSIAGVFIMGVLSGLIASPCTTAPLSAALLYVAQSGDLIVGGITLYALSLGMGLPLLLLGTSGGKLLPKAGAWMEQVKVAFGFVMLVVPLVLLERIIDETLLWSLFALWSITFALYLHHWQSGLSQSKGKTVLWTLAVLGLVIGVSTLYKYHVVTTPQATTNTNTTTQTGKFTTLPDLPALRAAVAEANAQGKLVIVDLYAEWCVACKEFEKYTFPTPKVQKAFENYALFKLDLTESDERTIEIMETFQVFGLPTILFFDLQGDELPQHRVTGFVGEDEFSTHLNKVHQLVI